MIGKMTQGVVVAITTTHYTVHQYALSWSIDNLLLSAVKAGSVFLGGGESAQVYVRLCIYLII